MYISKAPSEHVSSVSVRERNAIKSVQRETRIKWKSAYVGKMSLVARKESQSWSKAERKAKIRI